MAQVQFSRSSAAIDAGSEIAVGVAFTEVLDEDDADRAVRFILQNNSDTDMTIRLSSANGPGFVLKAGGGLWEEDRYAGAVYAKHNGPTGTKPLLRVLF